MKYLIEKTPPLKNVSELHLHMYTEECILLKLTLNVCEDKFEWN